MRRPRWLRHLGRTRADSPLRPAEDAITIDSTDLTLEQVIERAASLVGRYLAG